MDHSAIAEDIPLPISKLIVSKRFVSYLRVSTTKSVAFIATLMDSRGSLSPLPTCRGRTLAAAAEHERHMIGERTRHALAGAKTRGIKLGNPKQAETNRAKAAEQAQALRPHIERCIDAGRMSGSAIAVDLNARDIAAPNAGEWLPMQVRRVRDRLGL